MYFPATPNTRFVDARGGVKPRGTHERRKTHGTSRGTGEDPIASCLDVKPAEGRPVIREGLFDFFRFVPAAVEKAFPQSSTPGITKDVKEMITIGFRPTGLKGIQRLSDPMRKDL